MTAAERLPDAVDVADGDAVRFIYPRGHKPKLSPRHQARLARHKAESEAAGKNPPKRSWVPQRRLVHMGPRWTGGVYFVRAIGTKWIKIGMSTDIAKRVLDIHRVSPIPVELIAYIQTKQASAIEKGLHRRFGDRRVRFEWFEESPEMLEYIATNAKAWP